MKSPGAFPDFFCPFCDILRKTASLWMKGPFEE